MLIISNNPKVEDYFSPERVELLSGSYYDVLLRVRDYVHQNYVLLTHPLSGSIKPNETPYKSIAIEKSDKLDFDSLGLVEKAIDTYVKLQKDIATPVWPDRIKEDFMVIDFDLIKNALKK